MTWNQDEAKTMINNSNENPENDDGAIIISDSEEDDDCSGQGSGQSEIEATEVLSENMEESTSAQNDENTFDKMLVKEEIIEVGRKASRKRKLTSDLKHHYYYSCLDCEVDQAGSKVPITLDIASHIMEWGHINFQPISEVFPDRGHVLIENITFNPELNKKVNKEWQRLVFNADSEQLKTFKYPFPRKCLQCDQRFTDSADMFIHIRNAHVRKPVNKHCET